MRCQVSRIIFCHCGEMRSLFFVHIIAKACAVCIKLWEIQPNSSYILSVCTHVSPWMASYYSHTQKIVILRTWNTKDPAAQTARKWRRVSHTVSLLLMSQSSPRNDQINCWTKASVNLVVNLISPFNFCWCETVERWGQRRTCLQGYRFSRIFREFCLSL